MRLSRLPKDLTNYRQKNLLVKELVRQEGKRQYWLCVCDCGREKIIVRDSILAGSGSCGCGRKVSHFKHGHNRSGVPPTREYSSWVNAKGRCTNIRNKQYPDYGLSLIHI